MVVVSKTTGSKNKLQGSTNHAQTLTHKNKIDIIYCQQLFIVQEHFVKDGNDTEYNSQDEQPCRKKNALGNSTRRKIANTELQSKHRMFSAERKQNEIKINHYHKI